MNTFSDPMTLVRNMIEIVRVAAWIDVGDAVPLLDWNTVAQKAPQNT